MPTLTSIISAISKSNLKILVAIMKQISRAVEKGSEVPLYMHTVHACTCICSRTRQNDKKQSGSNVLGHPVFMKEVNLYICNMLTIYYKYLINACPQTNSVIL